MVTRLGSEDGLVNAMQSGNSVDSLWSIIRLGEFYSPGDLASLTRQPREKVEIGLAFLTEFGFIKSLGGTDSVFWKEKEGPSPSEVVTILQTLSPRQTTR
jgi:hypothetical protein